VPSLADVKTEIMETARTMRREALVAGRAGNVSARDGDRIHITPSRLPYDEMNAADVVTLDLSGRLMEGEGEPSSERRVHLAIYAARADAGAIVHTHSTNATAWSFLGEDLDTGTEELELVAGAPVRTAVAAASGSDEIAANAVDALEGRRAVLLARHGVVGLGETLREALEVCVVVERQAELAWLLRRGAS
jgi:L-fuculose-phosphate aldolase